MENIIAGVVAVLFAFVVILLSVMAHRFAKRKQREEEARLAENKKFAEEYRRKWRQKNENQFDTYASKVTNTKPSASAGASIKPPPAPKTHNSQGWPEPVQTTQSSDDGFLTGMLIGAAVNSMLHSSESSSTERSVGVTKSESSWGFDDQDSRSSISSSMDTSSSWDSSSSSDSWSSSDSGPSSDW